MAEKIEIQISPVMEPAKFNATKKQIEQLQKLAESSTNTNFKNSMNKVTSTSAKATKALEKGDTKTYNKNIIELYKNLTAVIGTLSSGSTELGKKIQKLSQEFIKTSQDLEKKTKELARNEAAYKKNPQIEAYKQAQERYKIPFTGKGNRNGYVKSEGGLVQTLLANSVTNKNEISDFNQKYGLNVDLSKISNINEQAQKVAEAFTNKITAEALAIIEKQGQSVENLTKQVEKNVEKQNNAAEELKITNPQDATALSAFQNSLRGAAGFSSEQARQGAAAGEIEGAEESTKNLIEAQNQLVTSNGSVAKSFKKSILGVTAYGLAIRQLRRWISQAVRTVTEIDQALTTQAMVSGKTRQQTYDLLKSYQKLADQCGATATEVAKVATAYYRQGKTEADALTLTETAIKAAKVAGISTTESVDYLTTAVNGFNLAAKDAMKVSDKFAALAASAAVSYDELATAMSKVASQANLAGMSIDFTMALLTKGIETTRESAESIGTALKTVLARMREITDYGETLEDGININNVETQLGYVNIALRDSNGELRSTEDVLKELGQKWNTLNANQQAAIAKALAGTRQQSRLIAMMNDYERTSELLLISQRSLGATAAQMAEYMSGMEAATNRVTNAYQELTTSIADSDTIIAIVNGAADVLGSIADLLKNDGVIVTGLIAIAALMVGMVESAIQAKIAAVDTNREKQLETLEEQKQAKFEKAKTLNQSKLLKLQEVDSRLTKINTALESQRAKLISLQNKAKADGLDHSAEINEIEENIQQLEQARQETQTELNLALQEASKEDKEILSIYRGINSESSTLKAATTSITSGLTSALPIISGMLGIVVGLIQKGVTSSYAQIAALRAEKKLRAENATATEVEIAAVRQKAMMEASASVAANPIWGWLPGLMLLTLAGVSAVAGIIAVAKNAQQSDAEKAENQLEEFRQTIYNTNKDAQEIDTIAQKFEKIGTSILKSKEELEEFNELVKQLEDLKVDQETITQVKNLAMSGKGAEARKVLEDYSRNKQKELIDEYRGTITSSIETKDSNKLNESIWNAFNADVERYFKNNNVSTDNQIIIGNILARMGASNLVIDSFTNAAQTTNSDEYIFGSLSEDAIKTLATNVENIKIILDENVTNWQDYITTYTNLKASLEQKNINLKDVLPDIDDLIKYYKDYASSFSSVGWNLGTVKNVSNLLTQEGNYSFEEAQRLMGEILVWAQGGYKGRSPISSSLTTKFRDIIFGASSKTQESISKYTSQYSAIKEGMEKYASGDINALELRELLANYGLKSNEALYAAMQGNYSEVKKLLENATKTNVDKLQADLQYYKNISEEVGDAEGVTNALNQMFELQHMWDLSLEEELKIENKKLEILKETAEKESEIRTKQLEEAKSAYEKYFDEIDKQIEEENYEEERNRIIKNMGALGASTDASSLKALAELEKELAELDKEREETLRQEGRDALLNNIDETIEQIEKDLEKLLADNSKLLSDNSNLNLLQYGEKALRLSILSGENTANAVLDNLRSISQDLGIDTSGIGLVSSLIGGSTILGDKTITNIKPSGNNTFMLTLNTGDQQEIQLNAGDSEQLFTLLNGVLTQNGYGITN